MPNQRADEHLPPADRRREVASILAKGLVRWHWTRTASAGLGADAHAAGRLELRESESGCEISLEFPRETRLSVVNGTRGLGARGDGDKA